MWRPDTTATTEPATATAAAVAHVRSGLRSDRAAGLLSRRLRRRLEAVGCGKCRRRLTADRRRLRDGGLASAPVRRLPATATATGGSGDG